MHTNTKALKVCVYSQTQVLSVNRIRHLLLSGAVYIQSPKTISQNYKPKQITQKELRHNRVCRNKQETGAEKPKSAPITLKAHKII